MNAMRDRRRGRWQAGSDQNSGSESAPPPAPMAGRAGHAAAAAAAACAGAGRKPQPRPGDPDGAAGAAAGGGPPLGFANLSSSDRTALPASLPVFAGAGRAGALDAAQAAGESALFGSGPQAVTPPRLWQSRSLGTAAKRMSQETSLTYGSGGRFSHAALAASDTTSLADRPPRSEGATGARLPPPHGIPPAAAAAAAWERDGNPEAAPASRAAAASPSSALAPSASRSRPATPTAKDQHSRRPPPAAPPTATMPRLTSAPRSAAAAGGSADLGENGLRRAAPADASAAVRGGPAASDATAAPARTVRAQRLPASATAANGAPPGRVERPEPGTQARSSGHGGSRLGRSGSRRRGRPAQGPAAPGVHSSSAGSALAADADLSGIDRLLPPSPPSPPGRTGSTSGSVAEISLQEEPLTQAQAGGEAAGLAAAASGGLRSRTPAAPAAGSRSSADRMSASSGRSSVASAVDVDAALRRTPPTSSGSADDGEALLLGADKAEMLQRLRRHIGPGGDGGE